MENISYAIKPAILRRQRSHVRFAMLPASQLPVVAVHYAFIALGGRQLIT
jgi:hypothetical protein